MEYDQDGDMDFQAWYHLNKDNFPPELDEVLENSYDSFYFLFNVYRKIMDKLAPALRLLMAKQYPVFKTEKRPQVAAFIDTIATTTGYSLLFRLKTLVEDQKKGVSIREKYSNLEAWKALYVRPQQPPTIDQGKRSHFWWLNDLQWEKYVETENKKLLEFFQWSEKRKFEFIDVVQTIVLKYFKELEELNPDEWIIYAVHMHDEYEYYQVSCENVELFIDCGFPEKDIKLSDREFIRNYSKLNSKVKQQARLLRNRRISGEEI